MLPNLLVIGAGKSGTTSLHYYLDQHPEIYMCRIKEPFFFQRENWRERLDWYEALFPKPTTVRGESSTSYSAYPVNRHVPERIHTAIPDAHFVYVVRDPIDRIAAQYAQHCASGKETRSLDEAVTMALSDGDDPVNPYICMSRYATQIEQYLAYFPSSQLLVIDNVELQQDRRKVLREAFRFLGVDETFESSRFDQVLNTERDQVRFNRLGIRLKDTRFARFVHGSVPREVRGPVTKPLTRLLSQRVERPKLSRELRARLTEILSPEVERLRELTGRRFANWSL